MRLDNPRHALFLGVVGLCIVAVAVAVCVVMASDGLSFREAALIIAGVAFYACICIGISVPKDM